MHEDAARIAFERRLPTIRQASTVWCRDGSGGQRIGVCARSPARGVRERTTTAANAACCLHLRDGRGCIGMVDVVSRRRATCSLAGREALTPSHWPAQVAQLPGHRHLLTRGFNRNRTPLASSDTCRPIVSSRLGSPTGLHAWRIQLSTLVGGANAAKALARPVSGIRCSFASEGDGRR